MSAKQRRIRLLLSRLKPSGESLLDWLIPQVDDAMLREIARADYDYCADGHYAALRQIRDHRIIPAPLPWEPLEVLNLTRWGEPDEPSCGTVNVGPRGHLVTAFCCAVLLKAADDAQTQDFIHSENDTLIQLVASVFALGREPLERASEFLAWRLLRLPLSHEEYSFFALALLLTRAALYAPGESGDDLTLLAEWVIREEARARRKPISYAWSGHWLLGLTNFDSYHNTWKRLASQILTDPSKSFPAAAAAVMRDIVERLLREPPPPRVFYVGLDGTIDMRRGIQGSE